MKLLTAFRFSLTVGMAVLLSQLANADIFDTLVAYRHGNYARADLNGTLLYEQEEYTGGSVDSVLAYTATNPEDGSINIVHCYSTRIGLLGRPREAQVIWNRLGFEDPDYHRSGQAQTTQAINIPIEATIEGLAVNETDLTAFLIGKSKNHLLTLHTVPGPLSEVKETKTFTFLPPFRTEILVRDLVLLPEAKKLVFFSERQMAEIDLSNYPFADGESPGIKVYDVFTDSVASSDGLANPDTSGNGNLYQVRPVYIDNKPTNEVFMLLSNVEQNKRTLRIDIANADQLLGSSTNIARINTNAESAFNAAHFAEVSTELAQNGDRKHIFVTGAYQGYPEKAKFFTISEVTRSVTGKWLDDKSQEFKIALPDIDNVFLEVLGIRKDREQATNGDLSFTVFLGSLDSFYRGEFRLSKTQENGYKFEQALLHQSIPFEIGSLQKVFFFPEHHTALNPNWPDFYFFGTTTLEQNSQSQELRTVDGLLISEFFYRKVDSFKLMQNSFDEADQFTQNGPIAQNIIYDNSRVLPEQRPLFDTVMTDATLRYKATDETDNNLGLDWASNLEWCAVPDEEDFSSVGPYGITPDTLVSYLSTSESSNENMLKNEIALSKTPDVDSFKVFNNVELMLNDLLAKFCKGDLFCASTVGLCFREKSQIFLCDADGAATDEVFELARDQITAESDLLGTSFTLEQRDQDKCYFASNEMIRMDGKISKTFDTFNSKKIFVVDPGRPPMFTEQPPEKIYLSAGYELETPIPNYFDPEGNEVYLKVNLRNATTFMSYDSQAESLVIKEGATVAGVHNGNYTITLSLVEVVKGAQMRPVNLDIQFEVVGEAPVLWSPTEYPPLKQAPEGIKYPKATVKDFLMDGSFRITFSKDLDFPSNLQSEYTRIKSTELTFEDQLARVKAGKLPLIEQDEDIKYISNLFRIEIIPGYETDPAVLGFSVEVTEVSASEINFQMKFDKPLEISQNQDPETIQIVLNVEKYTDSDGLSVARNTTITAFVPRQIPSAAQAAAIGGAGKSAEGATAAAMGSSFVVSILLAASLNQLWSMMNGLQLAVHMPLFDVLFPANATFFLTFLIDVATFDMMPGDVIDSIFDFPVKPPYNLAFQLCRYGSMYSIQNLGTCYMLFNIYIIQCTFFCIAYLFRDKNKYAMKCVLKYQKPLFWGTLIRLLFEGYLELCLSVFVSLTDLVWEKTDYSVLYCNVFSLIVSTLLIGLPVFIASFYYCHIDSLDDEEFIEKYGDIYDGLAMDKSRESRVIALFYPFWFVTRRLLLCVLVVLAPTSLWLQLTFSFITGMINVCYLVKYKPIEDTKVLKLEIMNEITNFFLLYFVMLFSKFVPDAEARYTAGWGLIFVIAANMAVHFSLLIKETYATLGPSIADCRKKKCCRRWPCKNIAIIEPENPPPTKKVNLSVIAEDDAESNFTNSEDQEGKHDGVSSEWTSKKGGSDKGGYNMERIRWNDLGRKYLHKKEKSKWAEIEQSVSQNRWNTINEASFDKNDKKDVYFEDDKSIGGLSFSQKRLNQMRQNLATAGNFSAGSYEKSDMIDHASSSDQYYTDSDIGRKSETHAPIYQNMPPLKQSAVDLLRDSEHLASREDRLPSGREADTQRNLMLIDVVLKKKSDHNEKVRYINTFDDKVSLDTAGINSNDDNYRCSRADFRPSSGEEVTTSKIILESRKYEKDD